MENCDRTTYADSCYFAADMYRRGSGVPADGAKAVELYERICKQKDAEACWRAGDLYRLGTSGVTKNALSAASFFKRACDGGYVKGCQSMVAAYNNGTGVALDPAQAEKYRKLGCLAGGSSTCKPEWADEACKNKPIPSCNNLGYKFAKGGSGFKKDGKRALALFIKACDKGDKFGCGGVGEAHEKGWGTRKSKKKALSFYEKACKMGDSQACRNARRVKPKPR